MQINEVLKVGKFYHIYNCGINGETLFRESEDHIRFLRSYERFIEPVCVTYAWVLMKNHFHLLVKIKSDIKYKYSLKDVHYDKEKFNEIKWQTVDSIINSDTSSILGHSQVRANKLTCQHKPLANLTESIPKAYLHFSHLFNSYAKFYNIKYKRHGGLFERSFKRKEIDNYKYFQNLVIYIHQNPVHHHFCNHPVEYAWSSYLSCISLKHTAIDRQAVIGWFDNVGNFKNRHDEILNRREIEDYLGL